MISISVIMPAYNEEANIARALSGTVGALNKIRADYEILVVDDGSTDKTKETAGRIARENSRIKVFSRKKNCGFGYSFREGVRRSGKEYITQFHADGDASPETLSDLIKALDKGDIITNYPVSSENRSYIRNILSRSFIEIMDILFQTRLKYYNGSFLCRRKLLENISLHSGGFAIYAEAKIRLMKRGYSLKEIPFEHVGRKSGRSKAISMKSALETAETIYYLIRDIYFFHKP